MLQNAKGSNDNLYETVYHWSANNSATTYYYEGGDSNSTKNPDKLDLSSELAASSAKRSAMAGSANLAELGAHYASTSSDEDDRLGGGGWGAGPNNRLHIEDVLVFVGLESLGTLAITGNLCLIVVLLRNKYLNRASFILMLSLAIADVLHGIVTTSFFYPPILLKTIPVSSMGIRLFNIIDWTAWSITLTHMSGICLDRLIAIMLYGRYNLIVTVRRIRFFTLFCWITFFLLNSAFILLKFCCLIAPLKNNQFYTFGYGEFETKEEMESSRFGSINAFTWTYTPLEVATIAVLSISNPITLVQLYRRHKRKVALRIQLPSPPPSSDLQSSGVVHESCTVNCSAALKARSQWQRASTMLLEMSMRMGSKAFSSDVRELAARRSNRQQQRILLQVMNISVVAVIFYLYMTMYYFVYHIFEVENKWVVMFNSFFYSTTHMINPVIYFSLNKEMRAQLTQAFTDFLNFVCCTGAKPLRHHQNTDYCDALGSLRNTSTEQKSHSTTQNRLEYSLTATETSPLVSPQQYTTHYTVNEYVNHNHCRNGDLVGAKEMASGSGADASVFRMRATELAATISQVLADEERCSTAERRRASRESALYNHNGIDRLMLVHRPPNQMSTTTSSFAVDMDDPTEIPTFPSNDTGFNNRLLIDLGQEVTDAERLELDLVSARSLEEIAECVAEETELEQTDVEGPKKSDDAFLNLAICLEEHARAFLAAQDAAAKRAARQRHALLDALVRALKEYQQDEEKEGEAEDSSPCFTENASPLLDAADASARRKKRNGGRRKSFFLRGENEVLIERTASDQRPRSSIAHKSLIAGGKFASRSAEFAIIRHADGRVAIQRVERGKSIGGGDEERRLKDSRRRSKESMLTEGLTTGRHENAHKQRIAEKQNGSVHSDAGDRVGRASASSDAEDVEACSSNLSSMTFTQYPQRDGHSDGSERFARIAQSPSWLQWREMKRISGKAGSLSSSSFAKITKRQMLRDSLLMLLDSAASASVAAAPLSSATANTLDANYPGWRRSGDELFDCRRHIIHRNSTSAVMRPPPGARGSVGNELTMRQAAVVERKRNSFTAACRGDTITTEESCPLSTATPALLVGNESIGAAVAEEADDEDVVFL